ncbi:glycosyltransferase [Leptothrix ochracea]|uniref:glycosyltransferase n=1 Tax=Leptothrix ochracea TaxID=735331 RepID=UPI0034E2F305
MSTLPPLSYPVLNHLGCPRPLELAVIIPTFNEVDNVEELVRRLHHVLAGVAWEAVFVDDDSTDGTAAKLHELSNCDPQVRCLRQVGRRGLSSACVEGMLSTGARFLAVMDADLQHDEALLAGMLQALRDEPVDLVVGTRYMDGGDVGEWHTSRQKISTLATHMSQKMLGLNLRDPMSGFFMLRRSSFEASVYGLSSIGFKILVDLVASSPTPLRVKELPYQFRTRLAGESKLDNRVAWDYLMLLADKTVGRYIPTRLVSFGVIGGFGVLVHLAVLRVALGLIGPDFVEAQTVAVTIAMISNFFLNNALTYRDQRLKGWGVIAGLLKFMAACSIGAVANVGVAAYIHSGSGNWLVSGLAGILVGTIWNYGATAYLVWIKPKRRRTTPSDRT